MKAFFHINSIPLSQALTKSNVGRFTYVGLHGMDDFLGNNGIINRTPTNYNVYYFQRLCLKFQFSPTL